MRRVIPGAGGGGPQKDLASVAQRCQDAGDRLLRALQSVDAAFAPKKSAPVRSQDSSVASSDGYQTEAPPPLFNDDHEASSVRPRPEPEEGLPAHRLRASSDDLDDLDDFDGEDGLLDLDLKSGADVDYFYDFGDDDFAPKGDKDAFEAYLESRALDNYARNMAETREELSSFDFGRDEGMWHERYRQDWYRYHDEDEGLERADADVADRRARERYFDDLEADLHANESRRFWEIEAERRSQDAEYERRRASDDYASRNRG